MSVQLLVLRSDQREPALNVVRTQVTVLASNGDAKLLHRFAARCAEGTCLPPHRRQYF